MAKIERGKPFSNDGLFGLFLLTNCARCKMTGGNCEIQRKLHDARAHLGEFPGDVVVESTANRGWLPAAPMYVCLWFRSDDAQHMGEYRRMLFGDAES